ELLRASGRGAEALRWGPITEAARRRGHAAGPVGGPDVRGTDPVAHRTGRAAVGGSAGGVGARASRGEPGGARAGGAGLGAPGAGAAAGGDRGAGARAGPPGRRAAAGGLPGLPAAPAGARLAGAAGADGVRGDAAAA